MMYFFENEKKMSFICVTHLTRDDDDKSDEEMKKKSTFQLSNGHVHVIRWGKNQLICINQKCISQQREHDYIFNLSNNKIYFICFKTDCVEK